MKKQWLKLTQKIDGMALRERGMVFASVVVVLLAIVNTLLLDPLLTKRKLLTQQMKQEQSQADGIKAEIDVLIHAAQADPDSAARARLLQAQQQSQQMHVTLRELQKGLVSPDKIAVMLEGMLKQNGNLRLVSLKSLSVSSLAEAAAANGKLAKDDPKAVEVLNAANEKNAGAASAGATAGGLGKPVGKPGESGIYRHGVEIVMQGRYPHLLDYMAALEAMPWQLYWSKAQLRVDEFPKATLTLTVYTVSLDQKWLNL